jgi:hypothetical protein
MIETKEDPRLNVRFDQMFKNRDIFRYTCIGPKLQGFYYSNLC